MRRIGWVGMIAALGWLWIGPQALAQRATERFIPIGKSPGESGLHTLVGEIESFDAATRTLTLTIAVPAGKQTLKLTDQTRIWIDRSKQKLGALKGAADDLRKGARVEVKWKDPEARTTAEWIKIERAENG
ncbi:MAG: hypothetical protein ACKVX9_10940 [Blastocatellia bacterium]